MSRVEVQVFLDNIIDTRLINNVDISATASITADERSIGIEHQNLGSNNLYTIKDNIIREPIEVINKDLSVKGTSEFADERIPWPGTRYYHIKQEEGYFLDLYPDTQINITYQISDVTDISKVSSSYTKTIVVPETGNNMNIFKYISDLSSDSNFNPNKKARAIVLVDSVQVLEGSIQLIKITRNDYTEETKYECIIYADNDTLWKNIGERLLTDLNMREMDHIRNAENVSGSWTQSADTLGYFYPMIDYGSSGNNDYEGTPLSSLAPAYGDWTLSDIGGSEPELFTIPGYIIPLELHLKSFLTPLNFYPAIYVKTIIDKIFQQAGFQYKSNFFNSTYFKNLIIPFSRTMLRRSASWEWDKVFRVGMGYIPLGSGNTTHGTHSMVMNRNLFGTGTYSKYGNGYNYLGKVQNIGNLTNTNTLNYTYAGVRVRLTDTGHDFGDGYYYPFAKDDADPGYNWNYNNFTYNYGQFATSSNSWQGRIKQRFGVYYKINEYDIRPEDNVGNPLWGLYNFKTTDSILSVKRSREYDGSTFSTWGTNVYGGTKYTYSTNRYDYFIAMQNNISINGEYEHILDRDVKNDLGDYTTFSFSGPGLPEVVARKYTFEGTFYTDWLKSETATQSNDWYVPFRGEEFILDYFAPVGMEINGFTASEICPETYIWNEIYPDVDPITNTPLGYSDAEPIDLAQSLPVGIKQGDFLMSVIKMFNLMVEPIKGEFNNKTLRIEPRDDFYASGEVKDWTSKVDRTQDIEIQVLAETQNKTTIFKFKDDEDFYNKQYKNKWNDTYGTYRFITDNDFIDGEKKIETIFAPAPLVAIINTNGFIVPKIHKLNGTQFVRSESTIRMLRKNTAGLIQNPYDEYWSFGDVGTHIVPGAVYTTYSVYPYAGHFDDPYQPTDDLNFGQTYELFYNATSTVTNQNLFTKYWYKQMNEYADKDSRLVSFNMILTPQDIMEFKFNDNIFIDGHYYKITKISGYDVVDPYKPCKVEALKTLDYSIPNLTKKILPRNVNGSIDTDKKLNALGSATNRILSSDVGVIGSGNVIADRSNGSFIAGYGNKLNRNNRNVYISGSYNLLYRDAQNTNIFGDENSVYEKTKATIVGNLNNIESGSTAVVYGDGNNIKNKVNVHIVGNENTIHSNLNYSSSYKIDVRGDRNEVATASNSSTIIGSNNKVLQNNVYLIGDNLTINKPDVYYLSKKEATISSEKANITGGDLFIDSTSQFDNDTIFNEKVLIDNDETTIKSTYGLIQGNLSIQARATFSATASFTSKTYIRNTNSADVDLNYSANSFYQLKEDRVYMPDTVNDTTPKKGMSSFLNIDEIPSEIGDFIGDRITGVVKEDLLIGQVVLYTDDGWVLADSTTNYNGLIGISLTDTLSNETATILLNGYYVPDEYIDATGGKYGEPVYLSSTSGYLKIGRPSVKNDIIRCVGFLVETASPYCVRLDPDKIYHIVP